MGESTKPEPASLNRSSRLIPVPHWNRYYDWPTVASLRHMIFNEEKNGFSRVVRRVGRRVLIDEAAFFEWVEHQNPAVTK